MHLPGDRGRFQLLSDTSKTAEGSPFYKLQNGTPKLIAYACKRLQSTAANYLVTELELLGLFVNISQFKNVLIKLDFDLTVDHLALTYTMKK